MRCAANTFAESAPRTTGAHGHPGPIELVKQGRAALASDELSNPPLRQATTKTVLSQDEIISASDHGIRSVPDFIVKEILRTT
jgi:hypothetical protein